MVVPENFWLRTKYFIERIEISFVWNNVYRIVCLLVALFHSKIYFVDSIRFTVRICFYNKHSIDVLLIWAHWPYTLYIFIITYRRERWMLSIFQLYTTTIEDTLARLTCQPRLGLGVSSTLVGKILQYLKILKGGGKLIFTLLCPSL